MTRATVAAAIAIGLASPAATASDELLARGLAELNRGSFEAARATLQKAARTLRERRPLGKALLHLGVCQAILGDEPAARRSFARALEQDPWLRLDPDRVKRSLVAVFESVLASLRGELAVSADAPDALVLLDGRRLGRTPYLGELPAGRYRLELQSADGALGHRSEIAIAAGRKTEVRARLVSLRAPRRYDDPRPPRPAPRGFRYPFTLAAGIAAAAVGAAALGVGISARLAKGDFDAQKEAYLAATDLARVRNLEEELQAGKSSIETRVLATNVLLSTTAALALTTAVGFLLERRAASRERPRVTAFLELRGPGAGVGLRGAF